jgi:hypothetical protein
MEGQGNERTDGSASRRRQQSETADDGGSYPGHGKGSGSRRENSLQDRDCRSSYGIHDFVTLGKISRQPLQKLARDVRYSHHSRRPA